MSDRHIGYMVLLEHDRKDEDSKYTIDAIMQIKGVVKVDPVVSDHNHWMAIERAKSDIRQSIWDVVFNFKK